MSNLFLSSSRPDFYSGIVALKGLEVVVAETNLTCGHYSLLPLGDPLVYSIPH